MQCIAIGYLVKIWKFIGNHNSMLMLGVSGTDLLYAVVVLYLLWQRRNPDTPVDINGLFIGFIAPSLVGLFIMLLLRRMAKGFGR